MILSNDFSNKFLDSLFRGQPLTFPTTYYVGLVTLDGEVNGDSYGRIQINCDLSTWDSTQGESGVPSTGDTQTIKSNILIDFGTALETWGSVVAVRFYSAPTGEDYIMDHTFDPITVSSNDHFYVQAGEFTISLNPDDH